MPDASPWRRLMCLTYEAVILFGVIFFFGYAFSALTQFRGEPGLLRAAFQVFMFTVLGVYFGYFWSHGRRSLPMKTMAVALVGPDDQALTVPRALARYVVAVLGLALPLAAARHWGAAWALLLLVPWASTLATRRRQSLYDLLCGTRLVFSPNIGAAAAGSVRSNP